MYPALIEKLSIGAFFFETEQSVNIITAPVSD